MPEIDQEGLYLIAGDEVVHIHTSNGHTEDHPDALEEYIEEWDLREESGFHYGGEEIKDARLVFDSHQFLVTGYVDGEMVAIQGVMDDSVADKALENDVPKYIVSHLGQ